MTERVCTDCGDDFEPYQWNQKRCYDCIEASDPRFKGRPKRTCPSCKVEFQPRVIRQMCCSSECGERHKVDQYYFREYGLTREQYNEMLESNDHKCMICGSEGFIMNDTRHKAKLVVDHDHDTGAVRGVLCHNCNRGLGLFKDSIENLTRAIDYLSGSD